MKHKSSYLKKYIAGVLTIALAAGVCQSYGSIEASAQEMTLPGIQQLVQEKQTQGDTFHILEIVADKSNASIGYLIGGEEPVSEGRKLSELPAASERNKTMQELQSQVGTGNFKDLIGNGPVSRLDSYQEGSGSRTEDIRGSFVARGTKGRYNYVTGGSAYRMLQDTEATQGQTRYDRKSTVEATNDTNAVMQGVIPTFTKWTSATMVMRVENGTEVTEAYAADRYSLQYYDGEDGSMNITNPADFAPDNYIGHKVYAEQVSGSITSYTYLGTIVQGDPSSASVENSENASGVTRSLSDNDPAAATASGNDPAAATASGNDPGITTQSGTSANLYVYNRSKASSVLWAKKVGDTYTFEKIIDGRFLYFTKDNTNGDYYVSKVSCVSDADFRLSDVYTENPAGRYVKVGNGTTTVKVKDIDADFIAQDTYDFIGDNSKNVFETVTYSGGFYNKEWFKKEVLNLSGSSRYEKDADYSGEVNDFNIEVTTLTLAQLAELTATDSQAYYGINLDDVDLIYLSGRGSYAAESVNMTSAATALTKMIFGIKDTTGERNNADRVPVVMDYGFYSQNKTLAEEPNNNQNNKILTQMALTILKVSDDSIAKEVASQGDAYWNGQTAASLSLGDSVKEALYDNVYLNDDSATPYVASDFLADCKGNAAKAATFGAVLKEIQYENFLAKKNNNNAAQMVEEISKASITRYILNWYMHRTTVKSELNVLDLQPSYDFDKKGKVLTEDQVKTFMGMPDYTSGNIHITHTTSAEFIGKIEDLNEKYDLIYLGDYIGGMNTKDGKTVFNDSRMDGMIYYHIGDAYDYSSATPNEKHRLWDDSLNHNVNSGNSKDINNKTDVYRGPGNDMNSTRYNELCQYIQAGYPVILADQYVTKSGSDFVASMETLDCNSYFYQLVSFALSRENGQYLYWQKNVFTENQLMGEISGLSSSLEARRNVFCNYLNLSKLTVNWATGLGEKAYPEGLSYKDVSTSGDQKGVNTGYLGKIEGEYRLQYIFSLENDAALSQTGTTYDCKLFVDKNVDGRFTGSDYVEGASSTASEEMTGLKMYVREGDTWKRVDMVTDSGGTHYALQTGKIYKAIRSLPDDYVGLLPWKLIFYNNSDRLVRTAKSGYTAIPKQGEKEPIKVLQLLPGNDVKWNLQQDLGNTNSDFHGYISNLQDWDVTIDSVRITELIEQVRTNNQIYNDDADSIERLHNCMYEYFQKYNMLIIGFADAYQFGYYNDYNAIMYNKGNFNRNIAAARAVRDYIESGRSVLFTHDNTSYVNNLEARRVYNDQDWAEGGQSYWFWGYEYNKTIRTAVGLDRYGALKDYYAVMANSTYNDTEKKQYTDYLQTLNTSYQYDNVFEPGSNKQVLGQKEGLTKYTVIRFLKDPLEALRGNRNYTDVKFPINNQLLYDAGYREAYDSFEQGWNKPSYMLKGTYAKEGGNEVALRATQVNEGQITQYPYQISDEAQNSLKVSATHYQWYQPNMELDRDHDGKNDIVVWYCLSDIYDNQNYPKNIYNIIPNDVVNNYYIYTMGNVTYSGAGHSRPDSDAEMRLFVNTIIAAYKAGVTAPSVSFQDKQGNKISSTYMIYDPANKIILKTENQGNTLSVRFSAEDNNVLSGDRKLCVEFYKTAGENDPNTVNLNGVKVVPLNVSSVKDSAGNTVTAVNGHYVVGNGLSYTLEYPLSEVGLFDTSAMTLQANADTGTIYAYVYTLYDSDRKTTPGSSASLSISAQELFELN
ncbi:MAG: hypothetical protein BHW40_13070 [Firmicutes bacterium CAG:65_45_313]|nr:MAG: hypothetical protein BHW40_13070 [Firmicutes bacterium CAG:65_45_313]